MWAEQNVFYNQHTITTAVKVEDIQIKQAEIDALKHSQKDIHLPPEVDKVSRTGEYVANLPDNPPISHAMIDVNMSTVCQVHLPHRNYDIEPITPVPSPQVSRSTKVITCNHRNSTPITGQPHHQFFVHHPR